jgi:hypothetical protein
VLFSFFCHNFFITIKFTYGWFSNSMNINFIINKMVNVFIARISAWIVITRAAKHKLLKQHWNLLGDLFMHKQHLWSMDLWFDIDSLFFSFLFPLFLNFHVRLFNFFLLNLVHFLLISISFFEIIYKIRFFQFHPHFIFLIC